MKAENHWIIGTWAGTTKSKENIELILNEDGTGKWNAQDIVYFIKTSNFTLNGDFLIIFSEDGLLEKFKGIVYPINDLRMIYIRDNLRSDLGQINFNKKLDG